MAAQDVHAFGREPHDSATTGAVTQREFLARGRSQHATRGTAANGRSLAGYAQQALSPHCKHTTAQDVHAFRRAPHDSACTGTHHTGCCTPQVAASTRTTRHRGQRKATCWPCTTNTAATLQAHDRATRTRIMPRATWFWHQCAKRPPCGGAGTAGPRASRAQGKSYALSGPAAQQHQAHSATPRRQHSLTWHR